MDNWLFVYDAVYPLMDARLLHWSTATSSSISVVE